MRKKDIVKIYSYYANFYDFIFSPFFTPRLKFGIGRLGIKKGEKILEIGTGTGLSLSFYPSYCKVYGIDITRKMLEKAKKKILKRNLSHISLLEMDAENLTFFDDTFDHAVLPFVVSVVPNPKLMFEEIKRVTKKNGKILIINHFSNGNGLLCKIEKILSPLFQKLGWRQDFALSILSNHCNLCIEEVTKMKKTDPWYIVTAINLK